jgi:hypothetical protein
MSNFTHWVIASSTAVWVGGHEYVTHGFHVALFAGSTAAWSA